MAYRFVSNPISYHGKGAIKEISGIVAAKGFKMLGAAIKAIGFMALIAAITMVVDKLMDWVSSLGELTDEQKRLNDVVEEGNKAYGKAATDIKTLQQRLESFNGTKKQEERMIEEVNSQYGKMLGTYKTKDEWLKKLKESTEAYIADYRAGAETSRPTEPHRVNHRRVPQLLGHELGLGRQDGP